MKKLSDVFWVEPVKGGYIKPSRFDSNKLKFPLLAFLDAAQTWGSELTFIYLHRVIIASSGQKLR